MLLSSPPILIGDGFGGDLNVAPAQGIQGEFREICISDRFQFANISFPHKDFKAIFRISYAFRSVFDVSEATFAWKRLVLQANAGILAIRLA